MIKKLINKINLEEFRSYFENTTSTYITHNFYKNVIYYTESLAIDFKVFAELINDRYTITDISLIDIEYYLDDYNKRELTDSEIELILEKIQKELNDLT